MVFPIVTTLPLSLHPLLSIFETNNAHTNYFQIIFRLQESLHMDSNDYEHLPKKKTNDYEHIIMVAQNDQRPSCPLSKVSFPLHLFVIL